MLGGLQSTWLFSRGLKLISAAKMIPHPAKAYRGGEDAYFIANDQKTVGVADGVGGWADVPGADPAKWSRDLMKLSSELCNLPDPLKILDSAYKQIDKSVQGSTTALVAKVIKDVLHVCSVGDSSLAIYRNGKWLFQTADSIYGFNFPLQLGSRGGVSAKDGTYDKVDLKSGDVLVLGTDGLWDNVWGLDIETHVNKALAQPGTKALIMKALADTLANEASQNGGNSEFYSPFAEEAKKWGHRYLGGKLDDVTVVTCYVANDNE